MRTVKIEGTDLDDFLDLFVKLWADSRAWENSALELGLDSEGVKARLPGGKWSQGYGTPQRVTRDG